VLVNQINFHPRLDCRVAGFLDDDSSLHGSRLGGTSVLGGLDEAASAARTCGASDVLVMAGSLTRKSLRRLMDHCERARVGVKIIANVYDLINGVSRSGKGALQLRDVDINDLLRREPIELDSAAVGTLLAGRVIMVTGAGGSIGAEICRQVLRFAPRALLLVERAENNLFQIDRELRGVARDGPVIPCLADVTDQQRMRHIFEKYTPEVVFHAAAHKHVPLMEANPAEAIQNNAGGTRTLADLASEYGLAGFVLISTDKAV